jgi:uncharacterized protein YaiE (UPF0345 family)
MKVNEYFDGKVMSIGFENAEGRATAGVMQAGDYEFGTSETEHMKVVSGSMNVRLPGETEFKTYATGSDFHVNANVKFDVQVKTPTAYLCFYGG